jgi:hypothetical protein
LNSSLRVSIGYLKCPRKWTNIILLPRTLKGELEHNLSIFIRDEVMSWNIIAQAKMSEDFNTREVISKNIDMVVKRSRLLACEMERKTVSLSFCLFRHFRDIFFIVVGFQWWLTSCLGVWIIISRSILPILSPSAKQ